MHNHHFKYNNNYARKKVHLDRISFKNKIPIQQDRHSLDYIISATPKKSSTAHPIIIHEDEMMHREIHVLNNSLKLPVMDVFSVKLPPKIYQDKLLLLTQYLKNVGLNKNSGINSDIDSDITPDIASLEDVIAPVNFEKPLYTIANHKGLYYLYELEFLSDGPTCILAYHEEGNTDVSKINFSKPYAIVMGSSYDIETQVKPVILELLK